MANKETITSSFDQTKESNNTHTIIFIKTEQMSCVLVAPHQNHVRNLLLRLYNLMMLQNVLVSCVLAYIWTYKRFKYTLLYLKHICFYSCISYHNLFYILFLEFIFSTSQIGGLLNLIMEVLFMFNLSETRWNVCLYKFLSKKSRLIDDELKQKLN